MLCKHCGSQLPNGADFCSNCGAKNEVSAAPRPVMASPVPNAAPE